MDHSDPSARPVLVLDFGAQYVQLIARRVRERHAFARIVRHDITPERVRELEPAGLDPLGRAEERLRAGGAALRPRALSTWASRSWGSATACNWPPRSSAAMVQAAAGAGVRPGRVPGPRRRRAALPRRPPRDDRLDEPRRPGPGRRPATSSRWPSPSTCPIAAVQHRSLPFYGLQFHPEVSHTPYGSLILGNFLDRICGNPRNWTMGAFIERSVEQICPPGRSDRPGRLRALGRRRFGGLRGAPGEGPRPAGRLRVRRHRAAPRGRAGGGRRGVRVADRAPSCGSSTPADRFLDGPRRRDRPAGEAAADRPHVHRRLPRRGPLDRRRPVPGPGDALPRRDRERRRARRPGGDDQDPPQRRRPARGARLRADRAAPRPVQGRGPPAGHRAGPARLAGLAAPVPRPGPGRPLPGRGDRRAARGPPPGRRHLPRRAARPPAWTARSPRRSPCSCRCSPSA